MTEFVHTVTIGSRLDSTYVFEDHDDAKAFLDAAKKGGKEAIYDEQVIIDHAFAQEIILGEIEESHKTADD